MSRAVWIKLNDIRIRADEQCGAKQELYDVIPALIALYDVPSILTGEDWGFDEMWLDYAIYDPINRAMGEIPLRSLVGPNRTLDN